MHEIWSFEHSVDCPVTLFFAWDFWTTVENWKLDADVESIELTGPFAPGSRGATLSKSSGRVEWWIADVRPGAAALIEVPFPEGVGRFQWTFEERAGATRITQRASIAGAPSILVEAIAHDMEQGIPAGMRKLCCAMAAAAPLLPANS